MMFGTYHWTKGLVRASFRYKITIVLLTIASFHPQFFAMLQSQSYKIIIKVQSLSEFIRKKKRL